MNTFLRPALRLLALSLLGACAAVGLSSCTTMDDPAEDTTVYPTPAEKNQQMQEHMSQMTRSFL